jgi:hypothetical protein
VGSETTPISPKRVVIERVEYDDHDRGEQEHVHQEGVCVQKPGTIPSHD